MNPIERNITWIDVLLKGMAAKTGIAGYGEGKHYGGTTDPSNASRKRQQRNKRERQARQAAYKHLRS